MAGSGASGVQPWRVLLSVGRAGTTREDGWHIRINRSVAGENASGWAERGPVEVWKPLAGRYTAPAGSAEQRSIRIRRFWCTVADAGEHVSLWIGWDRAEL